MAVLGGGLVGWQTGIDPYTDMDTQTDGGCGVTNQDGHEGIDTEGVL